MWFMAIKRECPACLEVFLTEDLLYSYMYIDYSLCYSPESEEASNNNDNDDDDNEYK